jgi:hypothetical protein
MATKTAPKLKKGDRVVATAPFPEVPEGTPGKLKMVNGLGPWMRAWVQFDNGVWLGSVSIDKLTRERDWSTFQARRAEEAEAAAARAEEAANAPAVVEAPAAADAAPAAAASKVPAHLLERAKAAREKKAAAEAGG